MDYQWGGVLYRQCSAWDKDVSNEQNELRPNSWTG